MSFYFGEPWPSGVCDDGEQRPTPVGELCLHCSEAIEAGDRGMFLPFAGADGVPSVRAAHRECALRAVDGGIGHHVDHDFWCSDVGDPNGGLSYRQSALKVWDMRINGRRPTLG